MVKSPRIRHSQPRRDPVTIDLEAKDVVRSETAKPEAKAAAAPAKGADAVMTPPAPASPEAGSKSASAKPAASAEAKPDRPLLDDVPAAAATKAAPGPADPKPSESPASSKPDERSRPPFGRDSPPTAAKSESSTAGSVPPAASKVAPKSEPARRGGLSLIAAGVIGGVVALGAGGALQVAGVLPPLNGGGDNAVLAALQADVAALKEQPAAPAGDSAATEELAGRIDGFAAEIEALKADLAAVAAASGTTDTAGATQALDDRFRALETALESMPQGGGGDMTALNERLASLEAGLADAARAAQEQATTAETARAEMVTRLAALEETVSGLATRVEEQAEQPNAALAISASALKAAIDRGDPFMTELETFAAISPDAAEIEPLRGMAASGVPSRTAIAAAFPDAAAAMIAAARTSDPNAGILDRLMSSAQSLVQVRPVGMVAGEDAPAIVARMEVAIEKGDYAAALSEYRALPEAARAAGADYAARIEARHAADELTGKVLSAALKA